MKRRIEFALIGILAYTLLFSAAMPARAQDELIIYPCIPYAGDITDRWLAIGDGDAGTDIDADDGADQTAYEDSDNAGEDLYGDDYAGTADADSGRVESTEELCELYDTVCETDSISGDSSDRTDPVLTYCGDWTISFYCPCESCCGVWATGCTASGVTATPWHTVATDMFDFGTTLYVDGLGYFTVEDRGVSGEWLDVFVSDHSEALALGLQYRSVYIVEG